MEPRQITSPETWQDIIIQSIAKHAAKTSSNDVDKIPLPSRLRVLEVLRLIASCMRSWCDVWLRFCLHLRSIYLIDTEKEEVSLDRRVEREKHTMKMKMICQDTIIIMRTWLESQQKMKNLLDVDSRRNRRDDEEKLRNNFTLNVIAVVFVAPVPGYDSIWIRQRRGNVETSADTRAKFNKQKRFWLLRGEKKTSLDCAVHKNFDDFCARRWRFRFFIGDRILIYF